MIGSVRCAGKVEAEATAIIKTAVASRTHAEFRNEVLRRIDRYGHSPRTVKSLIPSDDRRAQAKVDRRFTPVHPALRPRRMKSRN